MNNTIVRKIRALVSMLLVVAMLMPSLALAAPGMLVLPPMVTAIEEEAFQGNTSIRTVEIPDGTESIGVRAFEGCTALETVIIPDSVISIGEDAFANCANVVIHCSRDSYAAEYAAENGLAVQYPAVDIEAAFEQMIDTVYIGGGNDYLMGAAELEKYDEEQHGEVVWTLVCLDDEETAPVKMYLETEGSAAYIRYTDVGYEPGEVSYELSVSCSGYEASYIYTLNVTEAPEGLPEDIVYVGVDHFQQNDVLTLDANCVEFVGGDFEIGDENIRFVLPGLTSFPVWEENMGEWTGEGYYAGAQIIFTQENGRYAVPLCVILGNVEYYIEAIITVGNGIPADAALCSNSDSFDLYLYETDGIGFWVDDFWMEGYPYGPDLTFEWDIELLESTAEEPLMATELYTHEDELYAFFNVYDLTGETGTEKYRISLKLGEETYTYDYTVNVCEPPEDLPTALAGYESDVALEIGETYELLYSDITFADGVVPEGARFETHLLDTWQGLDTAEGFEWLWDDEENLLGFRFTPADDGLYVIYVEQWINNYCLREPVVIRAGSGIPEDAQMWADQPNDTLFLAEGDSCEDMWVGHAEVEGYPYAPGQNRIWDIELLESSNDEEPVMELYLEEDGGSRSVELLIAGVSGETGHVTYRVSCTIDGIEFYADYTFYVREWPEYMPEDSDLNLPDTFYNFDVGDTYTFRYEDITVDNLPEDMDYRLGIDGMSDPWPLEQLPGFEWTDEGFTVEFSDEGMYFFRVCADMGINHGISKTVCIVVGEDPMADAELTSGETTEQIIYMGEDLQTGDMWLNNAFLTGFDYDEGLPYEWRIDIVESSNDEPVAHVDFDGEWGDMWGADLWLYGISGETGSVTYRVTLSLSGREFVRDYTITVMDLPENLPDDGALVYETDNRVEVGERFEFRVADVIVNEDLIPEGWEHKLEWYWVDDWNPNTLPNFEWLSEDTNEGFAVTFDNEGRAYFRMGLRFAANYAIERNVYITAGDGIDGEVELRHSDERMPVAYTESDRAWFGGWALTNYTPMESEDIQWNLECLTEGVDDPVLFLDEIWNNGLYSNVRVREWLTENDIGEQSYRMTAKISDELVFTDEFSIRIEARPEDLPECFSGFERDVHIDVGDVYELTTDMCGFEGNLPEDAVIRMDVSCLEWGLEWTEGFEVIYDEETELFAGIRFEPTHNGRYSFMLEGFINNVYYCEQIFITVGDGVWGGEAALGSDSGNVIDLYAGAEGYDRFLGYWWLPDVGTYEGDEIEWTLERITDTDAAPLVKMGLDAYFDDMRGVGLFYNLPDDSALTGTEVYRLTAAFGSMSFSEEITVNILPLPEDLPTAVSGIETEIHINAGEELEYSIDGWAFADGTVPEDAAVSVRFGEMYTGWDSDFDWMYGEDGCANGIYFLPRVDGEYYFDVEFTINSYAIPVRVHVNVGEGPRLLRDRDMSLVYVDGPYEGERIWLDNVYLGACPYDPDAEIMWTIKRVDSTNETPVSNVVLTDVWGADMDMWGAELYIESLTGEEGTDTYEVVLNLNGVEYVREYTVTAALAADDLPTDEDVVAPETTYYFDPGDFYEFNYDEYSVNNLPDGVEARWSLDGMSDPWPLEELEGFYWTENGFAVYLEEGRYTFRVNCELAVNYSVGVNIVLLVGDVSYEELTIQGYPHADVLYYDMGEAYIGNWQLENFQPTPADNVEWVLERGYADFQTEEPIVSLHISEYFDDGRGVHIQADNPNLMIDGSEYYGSERYYLRCFINGVEVASTDFVVTVDDLPEDMPDELWVESSVYRMELGEEFAFTNDMFGLPEGVTIPGDPIAVKEHHCDESLQEHEGFEWLEDGFRIVANEDCAFRFNAALRIGNYTIFAPVTLIYGTGMSENFGVDFAQRANGLYMEHGDALIAEAWVRDYVPLSEEGIVWSVEKVGEPQYTPVEMYIEHTEDYGCYARISARETGWMDGEITWKVKAVDGENVLFERDITLFLADLPEDIATGEDIWVESLEYAIQPGEEFVFTYDMFGMADEANVPDGMEPIEIFHGIECLENHGYDFEWLENGIRVRFDSDGRHNFRAAIWLGNYCIERTITITVGSGISDHFNVSWNDNATELFRHNGDAWVTDVTINNYAPPSGSEVKWDCYIKGEPEYVPVEMYILDIWDDGYSAGFHAYPIGDDYGEVTWVITATAGDETIVSREITLYLTEAPEDLPDEVIADETMYIMNLGDTFYFDCDMFAIEESEWSGVFREEVWPGYLTEMENFQWNEDGTGFTVTLSEEGRYEIDAAAIFNNYTVIKSIGVVVGDGAISDYDIFDRREGDTIYMGEGIAEESCYLFAQLICPVFENEQLTWSLECNTADDGEAVEFELRPSEDNTEVEVYVVGVNALGYEEYTLRVTSDMGSSASYDFDVNVVELPEDMPTALTLEGEVQMNIGDVYEFVFDDVGFADGTVPDGAWLGQRWLEVDEDTHGVGPFEWTDDGFRIIMEQEGRYGYRYVQMINNYRVEQYVTITVGDGIRADDPLEIWQDVWQLYNDGDDVRVATLKVPDWGYDLLEGEEFRWSIEKVDGSEQVPVELFINHIHDGGWGADIHSCNLTGETGWVVYRVTVETNGFTQSRDITISVDGRPDDLPSSIQLPVNEYHVAVGDTLAINWRDGYETTDDGVIPDGAYICDMYHVSEETFPGEAFAWDEDGMGFSVTFSKDGRYVFKAGKYINNVFLYTDVVVYVGTGVPEGVEIALDQRFSTAFNVVEENVEHYIAKATLDGYEPVNDEMINWYIELVEPAAEPAAEMIIWPNDHHNICADVHITNLTGATGSVTYRLTAEANNGLRFTKDITIEIVEQPDSLPTEMTGVETDVQLDVGQEYTFDMAAIGYEGGDVPEGIEVYLEYFTDMYPLERLESFQWNDDGGFTVTFHRDGTYEFRVAYRIGVNYYVFKDVLITIGAGMAEDVNMHINELTNVMIIEEGQGSKADQFEVFLNYEPYEGEKVEWSVERLDGGDNPPVALFISEIRDNQTCAVLTAENVSDEPGTVNFRVHVMTESGWRGSVDYAVEAIHRPDYLPTTLGLPESYQLNLNETFEFNARDMAAIDTEIPENVKYHFEVVPDEALLNASGFQWGYNGTNGTHDFIRFIPDTDGRYNLSVCMYLGNWSLKHNVTLIVGDGMADNVSVAWEQFVETAYVGLDSGYLLGYAVLENYNMMPGEEVRWDYVRLEEGDEGVAEIWTVPYGNEAEIRYGDITSTGTVIFRVTAITDSGFTDSHDYTLTIKDRPENLPTDFTIASPLDYEVDDTMIFLPDDVVFSDGEVPEDNNLRIVLPGLDSYPIWYENEAAWNDEGGVTIKLTRDSRYEFPVTVMIGNYTIEKMFIIDVGNGRPDSMFLNAEQPYNELFLGMDDDAWIGNAYLAGFPLREGEEVEWNVERIGSSSDAPVVDLYVNNTWDGGLGANLHTCGLSEDETGWAEFRVTATVNGHSVSGNYVIYVNSADDLYIPENDAIELEQTDFELAVGEEMQFLYADIGFNIDLAPEGRNCNPEIWTNEMIDPYVEWTEEGILLNFDKEGRYSFRAAVRFNANCYISREIRIVVGDGISEDVSMTFYQRNATYFLNCGYGAIGEGSLNNYIVFEGEEIHWSVAPKDPEAARSVDLEVWETYDETRGVSIWAGQCGDEASTDTFILTCTTDSGFTATQEIVVEAVSLPEDMPVSMLMAVNSYNVQPGERVEIVLDYELDGTVPEDVPEYTSLQYVFSELDVNGNIVEWNDDGLFVTFADEGRYSFRLLWKCSNYTMASDPVQIIVGDGVASNAKAEMNIPADFIYANCGEGWFADAWLENYNLFAGESVEWELQCLNLNPVSEVFINEVHGSGEEITLHAASHSDRCGSDMYRLIARTGDGVEFTKEFTIAVVELHENLPTELIVEDVFYVDVNEQFTFIPSERVSFDKEIPEGMVYRLDAYGEERIENLYGFYWIDGENQRGFEVSVPEDGSYRFTVQLQICNYTIYKNLVLCVGDGIADDAGVELYQEIETVYLDCPEDRWLGYAEMINHAVMHGEKVTWTIDRIDENETAVADLYMEMYGENEEGGNIRFNNMQGEGASVYRLTALAPDGYSDFVELTLNVEPLPENMPTQLTVQTEYEMEVGSVFTFPLSEVQFADGVVPENASVRVAVPGLTDYPIWYENEAQWLDDGFEVKFTQAGEYTFEVDRMIGNYSVWTEIKVHVTEPDA